jgi:CHAD domain-containing protein
VSTRLTGGLLVKPAAYSVRVIACAQLDEVRGSYERFAQGDDKGLHDLRVALRRLRSWLRAFRPNVSDTLRRKTERRLKALAAATNAARDAEVALQWLGMQGVMPVRTRSGYRVLVATLESERDVAVSEVGDTLARALQKLVGKLGAELDCVSERQIMEQPSSAQPMAPVVTDVLHDHVEQLALALSRVKSSDDIDEAHRARIAAKRLRYLLEPLEGFGGDELCARLKALQQQLGDIRDSHRFALRVVGEIGARAADDARQRALTTLGIDAEHQPQRPGFATVRPGFIELGLRARAAELKAFSDFRKQWGKRATATFVATVHEMADRLDSLSPMPSDEHVPAPL